MDSDASTSKPSEEGTPPVSEGTENWTINSLNQIHKRLEALDIKLDGKFDTLDGRLRKVENRIWWAIGAVTVVGFILLVVQFLLGNFDVKLTRH